ncbi:methyl-CpG-binding domain protein 6-like [Poecile atricapillus]|uniref:methyl-CpG-binding domain protein 6-like n=1 Tax=Poecile atricapillus TaxID=48891 RepID=UPI00273923E9|nr:methyl-CpG-binding domain protein 6-like [Poecile atricapillus]
MAGGGPWARLAAALAPPAPPALRRPRPPLRHQVRDGREGPIGTPGTAPGSLGTLRSRLRETPGLQPLVLLLAEETDPVDPWEEAGPDPGAPPVWSLTPATRAQLLQLPAFGGVPGGSPPILASADPAPLQSELLRGGSGLGGPRLASLALHPALPPPLRLFFLLCLLEGGDPKTRAPPPALPPHLAAALFPGGGGDPPEMFLPRFEAAAAFCSRISGEGATGGSPHPKIQGGREWLWGLVGFLGGGPPVLFCRAVVSYRRWFGGVPGGDLGGAAGKLLGGGHPAAPPHLLELAKVLGGSLGGALMSQVLRAPQPPPGTPQLRGVLKVLRDPPAPPGTPPQMRPQLRGYLRRALAAEGGALPPSLEAAAVFTPGGAPQKGGGGSFLAPLPPLELPLGVRLRPLALPPPWDPPRALRAFEALWGALGGGPETLLLLGGGAAAPPPALAPLLVPPGGGGGAGGGWALAAAAPPRGLVLARGGPGGEGRVRGQRWGGVLLLARLLRGEGGA